MLQGFNSGAISAILKSQPNLETYNYSYWDKKGKYQSVYESIWEHAMPSRGKAEVLHVEAVRGVGRFIYDYYNNGFCNVIARDSHDCSECGGSGYDNYGEEDEQDCQWCGGDCRIDVFDGLESYYKDMAESIAKYLDNDIYFDALEELAGLCYDESISLFRDDTRKVLDVIADRVLMKFLGLAVPEC